MNACIYTIHIEQVEDGYLATVPTLPGCMARGESYEAALTHAQEAIEERVSQHRARGEPLPVELDPQQPIRVGVQVALPTIR